MMTGDKALTDRQMAVIYAVYKRGRISISDEQMRWLYEMNSAGGDDAKEVRTAILEAIPMIINDDCESANGTLEGLFEHFQARLPDAGARSDCYGRSDRYGRNDCCGVVYLHADSLASRVRALADEFGPPIGMLGHEHPDGNSYMGYSSLDELGITMDDFGYGWC